jgi:hypothetical protein
VSLRRYLSGLHARFDRQALRPPAPGGAAADDALAQLQPAWSGLLAWCQQGAGPGNSMWSQPGAKPTVAQRLTVAALRGPDDTQALVWADAFARQLDGSVALAALSGGTHGPAALALRLRVKGQDAMWWRLRQPGDAWDAGWAVNTAAAGTGRAAQFRPRRATLILADRRQAEALRPQLAELAARSNDFWHPVRWLWVGGDDDIAAAHGLAVARFTLV